MKLILIIALLAGGVWYLMTRAKENAAVQQVTNAPMQYTKTLQNDEARAKEVAEKAQKAIDQTSHDVQKAVEAQ
jgi:hypothetical protein